MFKFNARFIERIPIGCDENAINAKVSIVPSSIPEI